MTEIGKAEAAQTELETLGREFVAYVEDLKREWLRENRVESRDVYEVMRPEEQERVHGRIRQWERYITPLSESWWRERGYSVIWPDDNSKPMQVQKLEVA
jgi:hypothetical protein